jgi:uncharacterized protein involved in exopolysaccharide biosynthesis
MENGTTDLGIRYYFDSIRRRMGVIILFFVTTVIVTGTASFMMDPVYRASTTLLIDVESPDVLTASGSVALESQNYYTYKEYYHSQIEVLTSRSIARRVFEEFKLGESEEYVNARDPIGSFLQSVEIEPVPDTRLLRLHVEHTSPVMASRIANRLAEVYVRRNLFYISRDELLNLLKNEYLKLETRFAENSQIYRARHPVMTRLRQEMNEVAKRIDVIKRMSFDADAAIEGWDEYGYALQSLKSNNVSIEDAAEVPVYPVRPTMRLNLLIAAVVGLFGGVALGFIFEFLDDSVKSVEDVRRIVNWPLLGSVPRIAGEGR